jgi:hypothetical protein
MAAMQDRGRAVGGRLRLGLNGRAPEMSATRTGFPSHFCYGGGVEPASMTERVKPRGKLFRKYIVLFVAVVTGALLANGVIEVYFSYVENKAALVALQQEKAQAAAVRIEGFITEIERQMGWVTQPARPSGSAAVGSAPPRLQPALKQVPDHRGEPARRRRARRSGSRGWPWTSSAARPSLPRSRFTEAKAGRVFAGGHLPENRALHDPGRRGQRPSAPGHRRRGEPQVHLGCGVPDPDRARRQAFVVDGQNTLIAHPDISRCSETSLAGLDRSRRARQHPSPASRRPE